jgi:hypothetical protein
MLAILAMIVFVIDAVLAIAKVLGVLPCIGVLAIGLAVLALHEYRPGWPWGPH